MSVRGIEQFEVRIDDDRLNDLNARLKKTELGDWPLDPDWSYGVDGRYLSELIGYWLEHFDWREQEAAMNRYPHFRVGAGGGTVHFVHVRSPEPDAIPLVLTHGWPWTFWDFRKVIDPLVDPVAHGGETGDAFHVVLPSLPGYAFSRPAPMPSPTAWDVADTWIELMRDVLGYSRFGAHGGDMGAHVTGQLGHKFAHHLIGIHLSPRPLPLDTFAVERPWAELFGPGPPPGPGHDRHLRWERSKIGHVVAQTLSPQTLAYGLQDSPAGLAAWLLERRRSWSDCAGEVENVFSKDELLTSISTFWLTGSFGASARQYHDNWVRGWHPVHDRTPVVQAPTGILLATSDGPPDPPKDWMHDYFDLRTLTELPTGGHFTPEERPMELVDDIRSFFRPLRAAA